MATQYAFGKIVTDGLVLSLNAADKNSYPGSGTTWTDMSGNGNNGTLTNGPTFSSANGGFIDYDGTDDYVDCGNSSALSFGTESFTLDVWTRASAIGTTRFIVGKMDSPGLGSGTGYGLYLGNGGTNWIFGVWDAAVLRIPTTPYTASPNVWIYLAGVRDKESNQVNLYVNGVLTASSSDLGMDTTVVTPFVVGGITTSNSTANRWNGDIASTKVYNRALSASEVLQNYNATKTRFGL